MQLRYNYRLDPTPAQQAALARVFGSARVVYNDALRARQEAHLAGAPYPSDAELSRRLTIAKRTPDREWLAEAPAAVLQQALADLGGAYRAYFDSLAGKRKGPRVGAPRFRSRKDRRQSVRYTKNACFRVLPDQRLRLPKVGDLRVRWSRQLPGDPSSVTVIRDSAGRYFASFVVPVDADPLPSVEAEVGIDLGLDYFAVLSDGTKVLSPKFLRRAERKLRRLQREVSRKKRGSSNRKKAVVNLARAHAHVADARRDWQHKLSTAIVRENQAVYVEDLCVVGLGRTRMAESVHDAGWGQFLAMLEYKSARYGRTFARVDRFAPTSRVCSACGRNDGPKPLSVRSWACPCGAEHDRDVNAARNVLALGLRDNLNACGAQVRPASIGRLRAAKQELADTGKVPMTVASPRVHTV